MGSSPTGVTKCRSGEMVDALHLGCSTSKCVGSSPTFGTKYGGCSSEGEHLIVVQDAVGSSPISHPNGPVPKWFKGAVCNPVIRQFESDRDLKKKLTIKVFYCYICTTILCGNSGVRVRCLYHRSRGFKSHPHNKNGVIAQKVEQWTENPCAVGSIPAHTTKGNRGSVE